MYVITVGFEIHRGHRARFMEAIAANAAASLERESGCRQFDVCVANDAC
jgi:quinol monooxygenase YgiN